MKRILISLFFCSALFASLNAACKINKITSVPCTITESGKYLLCRDVCYTGPDAAITIAVSNVELGLFAHNIVLTDPGATGILVSKGDDEVDRICEISIKNDSIKNESPGTHTGNGIHIKNACKVRLYNMFTINHLNGLLIEEASDVLVERSEFFNAVGQGTDGAGAKVSDSSAVTFDNCVFKDNARGLVSESSSKDCKVLSCSFPNSLVKNLFAAQIDGLLVKNSSFSLTGDSLRTLVVLGDGAQQTSCTNTRFECCTFMAQENGFRALLFDDSGRNLIVDSCLFDIFDDSAESSTIELGEKTCNVHISNCTIHGDPNGDDTMKRTGINAQGTNTLIQDTLVRNLFIGITLKGKGNAVRSCNVSDTIDCLITLEGESQVVADSTLANSGANGLFISSDSKFHSVVGNRIISCDKGISVAGDKSSIVDNDVLGNAMFGIELTSDASDNTVQGNRVHTTSGTGIEDDTPANKVYFNTSHNNTTNYSGLTADSGVVVNPGDGACTGGGGGGLEPGANIEP